MNESTGGGGGGGGCRQVTGHSAVLMRMMTNSEWEREMLSKQKKEFGLEFNQLIHNLTFPHSSVKVDHPLLSPHNCHIQKDTHLPFTRFIYNSNKNKNNSKRSNTTEKKNGNI